MKIKKTHLGLASFCLLAATSAAQAEGLGYMAAAGLQYKTMTLDQSIPKLSKSGDLSASIPMLALQGVVFYDDFFSVLKVDLGLLEDSVDSNVPYTTENSNLSTDVSRNDWSIALGYNVISNLSVFGGYMSGNTVLTPEAGNSNTASIAKAAGYEYQQEYQEAGLFLGVSYGWKLGPGRLNTSLAYAMMNGVYEDNLKSEPFEFDGDSDGISLAVSWSAPINETFGYFVDTRFQQYSMDAADQTGTATYVNSSVDTEETMFGITGGVQMFF